MYTPNSAGVKYEISDSVGKHNLPIYVPYAKEKRIYNIKGKHDLPHIKLSPLCEGKTFYII